jgi:hypothetical protein
VVGVGVLVWVCWCVCVCVGVGVVVGVCGAFLWAAESITIKTPLHTNASVTELLKDKVGDSSWHQGSAFSRVVLSITTMVIPWYVRMA